MSVKALILAVTMSVLLGSVPLGQAAHADPAAAPAGPTIASKVQYAGTSRHLQISGLMMKVVNGMANLQIEITNSDYDDQEGYYRIDWLDDSGFSVWDEEAWKPILLHGGQKRKVLVVAPTPKALDFKVEFSGERNWSGATKPASE